MNRKLVGVVLSTVMAAGAAMSASAAYSDLEPVELVGVDTTAKDAVGQQFGELVAQKVSEITDGQLTIDYHANCDLGDTDLLEDVQADDIQIIVCQPAPVVNYVSAAAVYDVPMAFVNYDGDTIDTVINGEDSEFKAELETAFEASNLHLLGTLQNGTYRLTTANADLSDLASFSGLKIRTMSNANHQAFWKALGAEPTTITFSEVFSALDLGKVDGQENAADTISGNYLDEVQTTLACTNHVLYANMMIISKEAYDALDAQDQEALNQAVTEAIKELRPTLTTVDADSKAALQENGMNLVEYDASFYEEVLALDGVQALISDIDAQTNGLSTKMAEALAAAK